MPSSFSDYLSNTSKLLLSKKPYTKIVLVSLLFSLAIPVAISEIHANAACTNQVKNEIQKEIDLYSQLESAPSIYETSQKIKETFIENKKIFNNINNKELEEKLINLTKEKYSLKDSVKLEEDYRVEFNYSKEGFLNKAKVIQLKNYSESIINISEYEYELIGKDLIIKEIDWKKSTTDEEGSDFNKKLSLQNDSAAGTKVNGLGQSDDEVKKLIEEKNRNFKPIKQRTQSEDPNVEIIKDRRAEFRQKKEDLINIRNSTSCSSLKAKAALWSTYNRTNAVNYANYYYNQRNANFADFYEYGGNCTNYASQVIQAGGYVDDYNFYSEIIGVDEQFNFGQTNDGPFTNYNSNKRFYVSPSFRYVPANKTYIWNLNNTSNYYFYNGKKNNGVAYYSNGVNYSSLGNNMFDQINEGDIVWADWQNDGTWDHSMIVTGYYYDYNAWKWMPKFNYNDSNQAGKEFKQLRDGVANFVAIHL
jgi:Putative amidase domain